jgi:hypothetical protein
MITGRCIVNIIPQNPPSESAKFDVYIGVLGLRPTKENTIPLDALGAWQLYQHCTNRVGVTEVFILHIQSDTISLHYKDGKLLFP